MEKASEKSEASFLVYHQRAQASFGKLYPNEPKQERENVNLKRFVNTRAVVLTVDADKAQLLSLTLE